MSEPHKASLPDRPNLHWLKNRAKEKLEALRAANPAAKLTEAQRAIAREYGFASWRALKAHVDRLTAQASGAMPTSPPGEELVKAFTGAIDGDIQRVRKMLDEHPALATATLDGQTMLHHAAGNGRVEAIRLLVQRGAEVNTRWANSLHTPLSWAVTCEQREACEALVEGGAKLDLFCAAGMGRLNAAKACFDSAGRLLPGAAATGSTRRRADGTRILELSSDPVELMSDALYIACRNGHAEVAEYLLERGANPNFRTFMGATCFHWAYFGGGDPRIIAAMLAHGGDANALDADRHFTPRAFGVMVAASWGWMSKLRRILAVDASLAGLAYGGTTALHLAAKEGHADAVKCLLVHGADPSQRDVDGKTALSLAVEGAHWETVVHLKAYSTGPPDVDADGNSAVRRYTDDARKVMTQANREAERLNHEYIGTEHILLALAEEGSGLGADILKALGVDLHRVRRDVQKLVKVGPDLVTAGKLPQTPRAKTVVEYAAEEARSLNHSDVGTEHLLLGLLREHEGVAAQVLMNWRLEPDTVRKAVEARRPPGASAVQPGTPIEQ